MFKSAQKKLYEAAKEGNAHKVETLVKEGADVNHVDPHKELEFTPLHAAAQHGHLDIVKFLFDQGANINKASSYGDWSPLQLACRNNQDHVVRWLLDNGAKTKNTLEHAQNGKVRKILIEHILAPEKWAEAGMNERLLYAVEIGHIDTVKDCLENGADVNYDANGTKDHAFYTACRYGRKNIIDLLLQNGADVNKTSPQGEPSLFIAARARLEKTMSTLREAGADPHQTWQGKNLYEICNQSCRNLVEKFIKETQKDVIILRNTVSDIVLEDCYHFGMLERTSIVRDANKNAIIQITRDSFQSLGDTPQLRKAFNEHKARGGTTPEEDVFSSRPSLNKQKRMAVLEPK